MNTTFRDRVRYLLQQYMRKAGTEEETGELTELLQHETYEATIRETLEELALATSEPWLYSEADLDTIAEDILGRERRRIGARTERKMSVRSLWPWMAAAVLLFLVFGFWFLVGRDKGGDTPVAVTPAQQDVKAPEVNRAMITLADGSRVFLDSASQGELALQGNMKLVKLADGQIAYETASGELLKELQYNTLVNPKGSKVISLTLGDGSKVWLNAASSLRYPVAFAGSERQVEITGEAYFEVSKANKRFIVEANGVRTEVLGTHFNVHAYEDEGEVRVTLLEGSVNVTPIAIGGESSIVKLVPGQQAKARNNELSVMSGVDVEEVMAWKNGMFRFTNASIESIMREAARWYDMEVVYEYHSKERVNGSIPRTVSAGNLFRILEKTGKVSFRIEGRKVTVIK